MVGTVMAKPRMPRGTGSWHDLPDGRIKHSVSLGFDAEGKRMRPTVYGKTKAECRQLMAMKLEEIRKRGGMRVADTTTIGEWLAQWLLRRKADVAAGTITQGTWDAYERHIRMHIVGDEKAQLPQRAIARIRMDRVTVRDGSEWLDQLRASNVGGRAQQYARMVLVAALNDALDLEYIDRNPIARVPIPPHEPEDFEVWDIDEALAFLRAAKTDRFYAYWVLSLTNGPRPHEMLGLRERGDLDLDRAEFTITKQLSRHQQERARTKTRTARRTLGLTSFAVEALRAHRAQKMREGLRASPWVFPSRVGTAMNYRNLIEDHYEKIVKRADADRRRELAREAVGDPSLSDAEADAIAAEYEIVGLKRIRPYDLRHTYATLALKAGVPPHVVSESLGHTDVRFTMDTYAHVLRSMRDEHVAMIQELYGTLAQPIETAERVTKAVT